MRQKHDMRVLLVGDVRQHVSVEAGDFLRVLEAHSKLGRCQVEEIHRQIPDDYRAAVTQMAAGNVRQGLDGLDRMNWIKEGQSQYLEKAASGLPAADRSGTPSGSLPGRFVYLGRKSSGLPTRFAKA